jgi:hypothetical protein
VQFRDAETGEKKPALQTLHVSGDEVNWKEPAEQTVVVMHAFAPARLMAPRGQAIHAAMLEAPVALAKVFAAQGVGAVAPTPQKFPAGHVVHDDAPLPLYEPASQRVQAAAFLPPAAGLRVPSGHGEQAVAPAVLKVPDGQEPLQEAVDRPATPPKVPFAHAVQATAPATLNFPRGHCPLHAAVASAAVAPKVPPGHGVHEGAPSRLYEPARHAFCVARVEPEGQ